MEPTKQESVSRQSSILKPPKQRVPLQCVAANPSSENSPTIKIKRRVSFAKNKRIREFCNEAEQGTIWDNTYEEHDLSNTKSNSSTSSDHPLIISVPCDDKENFPVQLFLPNNELDCKEVPASVLNKNENSLLQCDMEMDNSINNLEPPYIETQNEEIEYPNTTIYCDDGMDITTSVPTNIIPCHKQNPSYLDDTVPVSQIPNVSMEITENIPVNLYKRSLHNQSNKNDIHESRTSNSTELTQAMSKLLGIGYSNKLKNRIDSKSFNYNLENTEDKTEYLDNVPMEFTSVLPSSTWIRPDSRCQNNEKTENFVNKTMELTTAVAYANIQNNQHITHTVLEQTKIFPNKSMEITEAIPVHNIIRYDVGTNEISEKVMQEKTKIFSNKSMEMTEIVPVYNTNHKICSSTEIISDKNIEEKPQVFHNISMEMTEAVSTNKKIQTGTDVETILKDKTDIQFNKTVEITEAVPVYCQSETDTQVVTNKTMQEKTKIFLNNSMEMTEAVCAFAKNSKCNSQLRKISDEQTQDRTNIFSNKSMEMTEALNNYNINSEAPNMTEKMSHKEVKEKTMQIYNNASREMTGSISTHNNRYLSTSISQKTPFQTFPEKTTIFLDKSMEVTEAVPVRMKVGQLLNIRQEIPHQPMQDKTEIFGNKSMEMTEVIPGHMKVGQLVNVRQEIPHQPMQDKIEIFGNKSMEITEAIPGHMKVGQLVNVRQEIPHQPMQDKTEIFGNKSMEMTEEIPGHMKVGQLVNVRQEIPHQPMQDKTEIFGNKSMETTEAIPNHMKIDQLLNIRQEIPHQPMQDKTEIFGNKSMEITEAIPDHMKIGQLLNIRQEIPHQPIQDKTEIFGNKSMEITEAIPGHMKVGQLVNVRQEIPHQLMQDKTEIFGNKSMEMTEAIPGHMKIGQLLNVREQIPIQPMQDKTEIFGNKSMEMTETIPGHMKVGQLVNIRQKIPHQPMQDKTEIFGNKSMEITEAIPGHMKVGQLVNIRQEIPHQQMQDKTEIFGNKSMEMTESVSSHKNFQQSNVERDKSPNNERTTIFNKSMEITEVVPVYNTDYQSDVNTNKIRHKIKHGTSNTFYSTSIEMPDVESKLIKKIPVSKKDNQITYGNKLHSQNITDHPGAKTDNVDNRPQNSNTTKVYHDTSMEMTSGLPTLQPVVRNFTTQYKNENKNIKYNDMLGTESSSQDKSKRNSQCIKRISKFETNDRIDNKIVDDQLQLYDSTKHFRDASMEFTAIPSISTNMKQNLKERNQYNERILQKDVENVRNSMSTSNNLSKGNNYEITDKYRSREENFHRMTSDELNILCASMNLPTQKYDKDNSITTQSNYMSSCNDVNVLRNSLEKNNIFQQHRTPFLMKNNIFPEKDKTLEICTSSSETLNKENSSRLYSDADTREKRSTQKEASKDVQISMKSQMFTNPINESATKRNNINTSTTNMLCETIPLPMEIDKTAEVNPRHPEKKQTPSNSIKTFYDDLLETNKNRKHSELQRDVHLNYALKVPMSKHINENIDKSAHKDMEIDIVDNINNNSNLLINQRYPRNEGTTMNKSINLSNQLVENSCRGTNVFTNKEKSEKQNLPKDKIEIYHDVSMELTTPLPTRVTAKRKSEELDEPASKNKIVSISHTPTDICESNNKNKNDTLSGENSLTRLSSNNTKILLATMDFKTELSCPLIINDKTIIKISRKSLANKTYTLNTSINTENQVQSNQTYVVTKTANIENEIELNSSITKQINNEDENIIQNDIPIVGNDREKDAEEQEEEEECDSSNKENKEPSVRVNLFPEQYPEEELDQIQPPSFLCSDSIQDDFIENNKIINTEQHNEINSVNQYNNISNTDNPDTLVNNEKKENKNTLSPKCNVKLVEVVAEKQNTVVEVKGFEKNKRLLFLKKDKNKQCDKKIICDSTNDKKDELLSPFSVLTEHIKLYEKRDDCIWGIRAMNTKIIALDFIAKSFIIIIRLNDIDKACLRDIENVEIISRLRANSNKVLLKIVHNLLLSKLNMDEILEKYKMYEDVLPMLEHISNEVIFAMNFMFDLKRLSALNLLNIDDNRIIFMVSSRKANIILKISLVIKIFNDIGADDINVTCILGEIRIKDIKQMIINIKKDCKFLSRYINDVKEYITLMEESTNLNKH